MRQKDIPIIPVIFLTIVPSKLKFHEKMMDIMKSGTESLMIEHLTLIISIEENVNEYKRDSST